jgi:hypothetical protein
VRFGSGVDVSNSSNLPRRHRTRVTEEINHLLGPDSDDEDKGEGALPGMFLSLRYQSDSHRRADSRLYPFTPS